jgi:hypothetical protein
VPGDSLGSAAVELPSRFVTVRLSEAIVAGTYRISAQGFVNLRLLVGGGDTTFVAGFPDPDSLSVLPDSGAVTADSLGLPSDTLGLPLDTLIAPLDTLIAPPDTVRVR